MTRPHYQPSILAALNAGYTGLAWALYKLCRAEFPDDRQTQP